MGSKNINSDPMIKEMKENMSAAGKIKTKKQKIPTIIYSQLCFSGRPLKSHYFNFNDFKIQTLVEHLSSTISD